MSEQPSNDAALVSRVLERLRSCGYSELGFLAANVEGGTVILEGRVGSFYLKQVAQATVMSMDDVAAVRNLIEVVR